MRLLVSPEVAQSVRELNELGWSQRKIADRLNISPTTAHRIIHGVWHPDDIQDDPFWELKLQAERCPGCGGLVYDFPCRTCEIRALVKRSKITPLKQAA